MQDKDQIILFIVIIALVIWIWIIFKRWLYAPRKKSLYFLSAVDKPQGHIVNFIEREGYEVLYGKRKVPIQIMIDDDEKPMDTQLFIDYFARKDSEYYLVKLARDRQPLTWTSSAIRDRFLSYSFIYEDISGILYVDYKHKTIKTIRFVLDELDEMGSN